MPKVLHVIHVAFEVETDKLTVLDNILKCMQETAQDAIKAKARYLQNLGNCKIEVI